MLGIGENSFRFRFTGLGCGLQVARPSLSLVAVPRGSYPTPFLGRLLFKITDPNQKTRRPKKGVGYEPLGIAQP